MLLKDEIDFTFYQTDWIIMQNVLHYVTEGDLNCIQYTHHFITGCILVSIIKSGLKKFNNNRNWHYQFYIVYDIAAYCV